MINHLGFTNKKLAIFVAIFSFLILESLIYNLKSAQAIEFSSGVNPAVLEIEAESPAEIQAPLTLRNLSDETQTYRVYLRPFKAGPDLNGEPNFDPELNNEYSGFFENVAVFDGENKVTEVRLGPEESKNLNLRINLEAEQEERDYYFTVVFLSADVPSEPETTRVDIRAGVGTNVLLSVGTKQHSIGRIASFSTPGFITNGPVEFQLELANHNDFFVTSHGNLIIKNMLGQPVGNLEFGPLNILENSNRLVGNSKKTNSPLLIWDEKFPIGIYKADLTVALSDNGPLLKESRLFVALPVKAIFIIIAIILLGVWLFKSVKKRANEK